MAVTAEFINIVPPPKTPENNGHARPGLNSNAGIRQGIALDHWNKAMRGFIEVEGETEFAEGYADRKFAECMREVEVRGAKARQLMPWLYGMGN